MKSENSILELVEVFVQIGRQHRAAKVPKMGRDFVIAELGDEILDMDEASREETIQIMLDAYNSGYSG